MISACHESCLPVKLANRQKPQLQHAVYFNKDVKKVASVFYEILPSYHKGD